jgi:hypothetical protein
MVWFVDDVGQGKVSMSHSTKCMVNEPDIGIISEHNGECEMIAKFAETCYM